MIYCWINEEVLRIRFSDIQRYYGMSRECIWVLLLTLTLTFDGEHHALADVGADSVAGLAQVVAAVLLQNVPDQQRPVGHELDPTRQRNRVVLLRVPYGTGGEQRTTVR